MWGILYMNLVLAGVFMFLTMLWVVWNCRFNFYFNRECSSPFECGFDKKDSGRLPFSLRFFSIIILFLVFDMELVLLMQLPLVGYSFLKSFFLYSIFLMFLILGLVEEWRRSLLDWKC